MANPPSTNDVGAEICDREGVTVMFFLLLLEEWNLLQPHPAAVALRVEGWAEVEEIEVLLGGEEVAVVEEGGEGQHADFRTHVSEFTDSLLASSSDIPGLDESIVISPMRLHLTLGVMCLSDDPPRQGPTRSQGVGVGARGDTELPSTSTLSPPLPSSVDGSPAPPSVQSALDLLRSLKPRLSQILAPQTQSQTRNPREDTWTKVRVPLERMDIMPPEHGDPTRAHVLWLGPSKERSAEKKVLWDVCRPAMIMGKIGGSRSRVSELQGSGVDPGYETIEVMVVFAGQLHCTILNTIYRSKASILAHNQAQAQAQIQAEQPQTPHPRNRNPPHQNQSRIPFSYSAILENMGHQPSQPSPLAAPAPDAASNSRRAGAGAGGWGIDVGFGTWEIGEVQLCKMGSHDPEGRYVSVGAVSLGPDIDDEAGRSYS
ncbi:hypothetical protein BOTBODRAFT_43642 [Botryobasidium botryosum FD-172 SS1]|uniref:Uncharacterized protein n=1 Tax=Botryobasidium botryosum (strain FD-172 SS1) TaxID=930990 RepID=A0A067MMR4_BOTB1|nr:hypothetical protein BOTBODRAFT_43642 [Botryobasidium botryosum FD-172 SS1]